MAFAGGASADDPAKAFVDYIKECNPAYHDRAMEHGYNARDMLGYLRWLKQNRYISSFTWVRQDFWELAQITDQNLGHENAKILLLRGDSVATDNREIGLKTIKRAKRSSQNPHVQNLECAKVVRRYDETEVGSAPHGMTLCRDDDSNIYTCMYDTIYNVRHSFSYEKYITTIANTRCVYQFSIELDE